MKLVLRQVLETGYEIGFETGLGGSRGLVVLVVWVIWLVWVKQEKWE